MDHVIHNDHVFVKQNFKFILAMTYLWWKSWISLLVCLCSSLDAKPMTTDIINGIALLVVAVYLPHTSFLDISARVSMYVATQ